MSDAARITRVARMDCRVAPFDWRFARDRTGEIAAHWRKLVAAKPQMFDGRVLLSNAMRVSETGGGLLQASYFETSFSAFMAWRDFGFPDLSIRNGFAMAALRSADGAFLMGEMGAHTANAGKVYFPAGTPDLDDIVGDAVDLAGSVARELFEETGIYVAEGETDETWTIVELGPRVACMRPVVLPAPADEMVARVAQRLAQEEQPELAGLVAVRSLADIEGRDAPDFIREYLRYEFSR